jgi:hypothetical protein
VITDASLIHAVDALELIALTWAWLWFAHKCGVTTVIKGILVAWFDFMFG